MPALPKAFDPQDADYVVILNRLPADHDVLINTSVVCQIMGVSRDHLKIIQRDVNWPTPIKMPNISPLWWRSELISFWETYRAKPATKAEA